MDRRSFLTHAALATTSLLTIPSLLTADSTKVGPTPSSMAPALGDSAAMKNPPKPPALDMLAVKDFVSAGHNNLDKVKEMLALSPNLVYASWDLGGGDFETALEGAGHVGDKEIARFLIASGARPSIFALTMLGETAIVTQLLEKYPELLRARGPHGFSILHHARRGEATELIALVEGMGLTETKFPLF